MPSDATNPRSAARIKCPCFKTIWPVLKSSPARRTFMPGLMLSVNVMLSASALTRSCAITVSTPAGTAAPVIMRMQAPF